MKGGHHVPEEDIRRRYYRSKQNFWSQYRQLANSWLLIYNSDEGFQEVALGIGAEYVTKNEKLFDRFIKDIDNGSKKFDDLSLYQFASEVIRVVLKGV